MIDQRLEARLRADPTGDPIHAVGLFRDRLSSSFVARPVPRAIPRSGSLGAVVAIAVFLVAIIVLRPPLEPAQPSPSPSPSPTIAPSLDPAALDGVLATWLGRFGADPPSLAITMVGPTGSRLSSTSGELPANPPEFSVARLGDASRVYIAATILLIDDCARAGQQFQCSKPISPTMRLDDPVATWWEPWPDADTTTIRQLLEGSSGLAPIGSSFADYESLAGAGTDRASALAAAVAAPRRFAPGADRSPVDTEWLILEEIIPIAAGVPVANVLAFAGAPPFTTTLVDQAPIDLMPGRRSNGDVVADLNPAVLSLVGNAGGISGSSRDLAEYATTIWGTGFTLEGPTVDYMTDAGNGRRFPIAATGVCPCSEAGNLAIRTTGQAIGWSVVMAYDFASNTAIGIAVGTDAADADLDALLQAVLALAS